MKIIEAITITDELKPNNYTQVDKIRWLSELDGIIKNTIIDTHEGRENVVFDGYDEDTDINTPLIVSAPYDEIYVKWLEAKIDYANAEFDKYNNSVIAYNKVFSEYARNYNRTHMYASGKQRFKF